MWIQYARCCSNAAAWGGLNCLHVTTALHRVNRPPALEDRLASLSRRSSLLPHDKGVLLDTLPWGAWQPSPCSTWLPAPRRRTLQVGCGLALQGLLRPSRGAGNRWRAVPGHGLPGNCSLHRSTPLHFLTPKTRLFPLYQSTSLRRPS